MMIETNFSLLGVDQLIKTIDSVSDDVKKKGGRFALRKAANVIADDAKRRAAAFDRPETPPIIAKNIAVRFSNKTFKRTGDLVFRVGVLGGARSTSRDALRSARARRRKGTPSLASLGELQGKGKLNPGGDTFYWRFREFGTEKEPARPFMRPALQNNLGKATNEFLVHFQKALDRAIKRANKGV